MVLRERLEPLVLGELAVQLAGSVPTEQKVHLERVQPVLRVRLEPLAQVLLEHSEE